jgi:hypothetical protein
MAADSVVGHAYRFAHAISGINRRGRDGRQRERVAELASGPVNNGQVKWSVEVAEKNMKGPLASELSWRYGGRSRACWAGVGGGRRANF